MSFADCSNADIFLYYIFSFFLFFIFFLFAGLYLKFSMFISKAGYETPVMWYSGTEVPAFSALFHCDQECTQFSYSVICAKNQLIVDPSQCNTYLFPEKTLFFFTECQKLSWSVSHSSRHSDFFGLRLWQTDIIKSRVSGIRCFSKGKLCSPISAVNHLVTWDTLTGLSLHW